LRNPAAAHLAFDARMSWHKLRRRCSPGGSPPRFQPFEWARSADQANDLQAAPS